MRILATAYLALIESKGEVFCDLMIQTEKVYRSAFDTHYPCLERAIREEIEPLMRQAEAESEVVG